MRADEGKGPGRPIEGDDVLAYDYPVLGVFWSILLFFL